jgi:hypothetical protein
MAGLNRLIPLAVTLLTAELATAIPTPASTSEQTLTRPWSNTVSRRGILDGKSEWFHLTNDLSNQSLLTDDV